MDVRGGDAWPGRPSARGARRLGIALVAGVAFGCGAAPIEVASVAPDPLLTGLVAHWPLDDGAGTTATDHSGRGYDGTLAAGPWIPGNFGGALHFDSGDAVSVPSFPNASASWSVALWARPASPVSGATLYTLISTENVFKGGWEMNIRLDPAANTYYEFAYWIGPGQSDYAYVRCTCVVLDQWTHLAAVRDGPGGTLSLYVNGVLQSTMPQTQPATTALPLILPGSPTLFLGRWLGDARLYVGDLDDVVVYDRSLVASEVLRLWTSPVPEPPK
jgi:hypothetical protein